MATKKEKSSGKKLKVTLVKSVIGSSEKQKATVEALGLKKIRQCKLHDDNEVIRGMIFVVKHLISVEEV